MMWTAALSSDGLTPIMPRNSMGMVHLRDLSAEAIVGSRVVRAHLRGQRHTMKATGGQGAPAARQRTACVAVSRGLPIKMLTPTKLGVFGENSLVFTTPDESNAFATLLRRLNCSNDSDHIYVPRTDWASPASVSLFIQRRLRPDDPDLPADAPASLVIFDLALGDPETTATSPRTSRNLSTMGTAKPTLIAPSGPHRLCFQTPCACTTTAESPPRPTVPVSQRTYRSISTNPILSAR